MCRFPITVSMWLLAVPSFIIWSLKQRFTRSVGSCVRAVELFFIEPLGDNPAAKLIRRLTPKARTRDEEPLSKDQIRFADELLGNQSHRFFNLVSVPVAMLTSLTAMNADNILLRTADDIDLAWGRSPMRYWMRQVVLVWQKR